MANRIHLRVESASGVLLERELCYVNLPTAEGSVGVLSGHAPMMCAICPGKLKYRADGEENTELLVGSGVARVEDNSITVLLSSDEKK